MPLRDRVFSLWTERLIWVRQFIISIMMGLRDLSFVAQRTLRNSTEFGRIISNFFGFEAGQRFENLLVQWVLILSEFASTVKANGQTDLLMQKWNALADEIADFLFGINPYWDKVRVSSILYDQMKIEQDFIRLLNNEQYGEAVAQFDAAHDNALRASQLMFEGVMHFPDFNNASPPQV